MNNNNHQPDQEEKNHATRKKMQESTGSNKITQQSPHKMQYKQQQPSTIARTKYNNNETTHNENSFRHVLFAKWVIRGLKCEVANFLINGSACMHAGRVSYL